MTKSEEAFLAIDKEIHRNFIAGRGILCYNRGILIGARANQKERVHEHIVFPDAEGNVLLSE